MKRIIAIVLILSSLFLMCITAYAEDSTDTAPDTAPLVPEAPATLSIDNQNTYDGMDKSYSEGYVPRVSGGYATVVIPLICDGELEGNKLCASVNLGDSMSMPFVCKNYEKTVSLSAESLYLVSFSLELKWDRVNGNYPVSVNISATDKNGNAIQETITVYIVINDGKDPNGKEEEPEEEIVLTPKVLVQSYECVAITDDGETAVIKAGDKIKVKVTLVNTSGTESLKNITVTANATTDSFILQSVSDTIYINSVGAGAAFDVIYEYETKADMPAGQYNIGISYDFAYGKGMSSAGSGNARVTITQPLEMELSITQIPSKAVISDTVSVGVQAINLSRAKAYNVRAVIEADGFSPMGTIFIGDVDGGMSAEGMGQVTVTGLTKGNFSYGQTKGTVTFYYEDADGNELTEVKNFTTTIESPFSGEAKAEEDNPTQWWIIMAVIATVIIVAVTVIAIKKIKVRKNEKAS